MVPSSPSRPGVAEGYCLSGGVSMRLAATRPERFAATASFHGGGLITDAPSSTHLLLPRIKARLYFGRATKDRSMPEEAIQNLDGAPGAWGGKYESEVYDCAYQSWTVSDSPVYHKAGRTGVVCGNIALIPGAAGGDIASPDPITIALFMISEDLP